jgi:aminopeptidase YwaD
MIKLIPFLFFLFFSCDDPDPTIGETVRAYVHKLESFGTRQYQTSGNDKAQKWILGKLLEFGYAGYTSEQEFLVGNQKCYNVIAEKEGNLFKGEYIIIGAHYDSISEDTDNAPGANDNASGVAVVLEMARELANIQTEYSIKFILWDAEEVGLKGSYHYVNNIGNENVKFYLNLDEIGGSSNSNNVVNCEDDKNNSNSVVLRKVLQEKMRNAGLSVMNTEVIGSDYIPFQEAGKTVIGLYEDPRTPHYHSSSDLVKHMDFEYLQKISNGTYQFLLSEAKVVN